MKQLTTLLFTLFLLFTPAPGIADFDIAGRPNAVDSSKRVVVFHPVFLQDALSLGVLPVAGHKTSDLQVMLTPGELQSIKELAEPVNPEQLAELHASLFISPKLLPYQRELFEILAPCRIIGGFSTAYKWQRRHLEVAKALGMEGRATRALAEYDRRARKVRSELAAAGLHPQVLMAYAAEDHLSIFGQDTNGVTVLEDSGLHHSHLIDPGRTVNVSYERLLELDCDALFIVPAPQATQAAVDGIRHQLSLLNHQPLWRSLSVVRNGHVYFEDVYWQNTTPLTADMMLQDIEQLYLHKQSARVHWPAPMSPALP